MAILDREQLQALKRQLEEEFRMDMAAIERLERRFSGGRESAPAGNSSSPNNVSVLETRTSVAPRVEPVAARTEPAVPAPDELEGTLRTMFSNYRK